MGRILECLEADGLAQLSYLVADEASGLAAVIDPRRDGEIYLERLRELGLRLAFIVETHLHADFVSGARELQARTGAPICGGRSPDYSFGLRQMEDGEELELGALRLKALHTPGHTPEHLCLVLHDQAHDGEAVAVFTGDCLFNLEVGRPDLVGGDVREHARDLYRSLFHRLLPLGDRLEVYPGHGAGSACGKAIGPRRVSSLGNERRFNPGLRERSLEEFADWIVEGMPEPPRHYARLKKVNARGPRGAFPSVDPLPAEEFRRLSRQDGALVLDARSMLAFGGGHAPGALNIPLQPQFPTWVGWMVDPEATVLLVLESTRDLRPAVEHLFRVGHDRIGGYLHRGMAAWQEAALPLDHVEQWTVHDLDRRREGITVLDVRTDAEWSRGHVPGAVHVFAPHLEENLERLDRSVPVAAYCGTGYRASIASSVLKRNGFHRVANVPGSWKAWQAAGLPTT